VGEKRASELFHGIVARNGLAVHPGNSVLANKVVSGELPFAISAYSHIVDEAKERGAPIDSIMLEPAVGRANGIGVSRRPPHPHAARLFYDYNLSEAQSLMVKLHYLSPLKKLSPPERSANMVFVDWAMDSVEAARCESTYQALIRKGPP
jgi:iron(III) transport system substrate-binding protein